MKRRFTRREFLVGAGAAGAAAALMGNGLTKDKLSTHKPALPLKDILAVAHGNDPAAMVAAAVGAIGGMEAFVKKGNTVVVKPNASWARRPEDACTTSPAVLGAVVHLCRKAGAAEVIVVDHAIDRPAERVFQVNGIAAACEASGAKLVSADANGMYRRISILNGEILSEEQVIKQVLDADVLINVPIAKHHRDGGMSLGLKNMMGVVWNRQQWHSSACLDTCIAEFVRTIKPHLTILDANRVLLTDGPSGPGKTRDFCQVIAGVDPVAVDAYGATLFGLEGKDVDHIRMAHECGVGEMDLSKVRIMRV